MDWYLQHHGIKGQKWGIRRYQNSDGSLTNAGKARYGTDGESSSVSATSAKTSDRSTWSTSKKSIQSLSDEELQARINRLNLETQYKQKMSTIDSTSVRANKFIADTGEAVMGKLIKDVGVSIGGYMINELAKSMGYEGKVVDVSLKKKEEEKSDKKNSTQKKSENNDITKIKKQVETLLSSNNTKDWSLEEISGLSNETLAARNTRLKLEAEYTKLLTPSEDATSANSQTNSKKEKEEK